MHATSLLQLIRHAYREGAHSCHYTPVEEDKDDASLKQDDAVQTDDREDGLPSPSPGKPTPSVT